MNRIFILILPILMLSCSSDDDSLRALDSIEFYAAPPPVHNLYYYGEKANVIPPGIDSITSQSSLISYADVSLTDSSANTPNYYSELTIKVESSEESLLVYLSPSCKGEPALNKTEFPTGMPITIYKDTSLFYSYDTTQTFRSLLYHFDTVITYDTNGYYITSEQSLHRVIDRGQLILLTDGYSEFADSSFNDVTIVPLRNSNTDTTGLVFRDWDFNVEFPFEVKR